MWCHCIQHISMDHPLSDNESKQRQIPFNQRSYRIHISLLVSTAFALKNSKSSSTLHGPPTVDILLTAFDTVISLAEITTDHTKPHRARQRFQFSTMTKHNSTSTARKYRFLLNPKGIHHVWVNSA